MEVSDEEIVWHGEDGDLEAIRIRSIVAVDQPAGGA